jgi:Fe-S-cluster containining protein
LTTQESTDFRPLAGNTFRFRCHKDLGCFTRCCAKLNLILTPYDVLRIKNRLTLSSDHFLSKYTVTRINDSRFPAIYLKMNGDKERKCPFVTPHGCSIYEDRPGACRIYPLGRAALKVNRGEDTKEKFFVVCEAHCLGLGEDRKWTVSEWMTHEGVDTYNAMNDRWLEIITYPGGLGSGKEALRKTQMFFMASYNLDKFRELVFNSRFFQRFEVSSIQKETIAADDMALMRFAFNWLRFSLFGEETMEIKAGPQ